MGSNFSKLIEANNRFAVDLHNILRDDEQFAGQNLFYSPSSLSIALAMTSMGARGSTAVQMSKALHWEAMPQDQLHTEEKHFLNALQQSNAAGNELLAANRLFVQKNFSLVQEFVEGTKKFCDAEIALVDYQKDAEGARKEVNGWVEEQTKQKIKNLIPEGVFNSLTRLTLVNAIYFKGFWQNQFEKWHTLPDFFRVGVTDLMKVRMMQTTAKVKHIEHFEKLSCQVLELPYQGENLCMVILLPYLPNADGLAELEESLTHEKLQKAFKSVTQSRPHNVRVFLPRFKLTQQFLLNNVLVKMGATDMLDKSKADFSGITAACGEVCVSHVIHKAVVEVSEAETEAVEPTEEEAKYVGCYLIAKVDHSIPRFKANHPFLFMICQKKSGAILFMGSVLKPEMSTE